MNSSNRLRQTFSSIPNECKHSRDLRAATVCHPVASSSVCAILLQDSMSLKNTLPQKHGPSLLVCLYTCFARVLGGALHLCFINEMKYLLNSCTTNVSSNNECKIQREDIIHIQMIVKKQADHEVCLKCRKRMVGCSYK